MKVITKYLTATGEEFDTCAAAQDHLNKLYASELQALAVKLSDKSIFFLPGLISQNLDSFCMLKAIHDDLQVERA